MFLILRKAAQQLGLFGGGAPRKVDVKSHTRTTKKGTKVLVVQHRAGRKKADPVEEPPEDVDQDRETRKRTAKRKAWQTGAKAIDRSSRTKHRDVGEKIGGAAKDVWAHIAAANIAALEEQFGAKAAAKHVVKTSVLGEHDVAMDRSMGMSAGCSFLRKLILKAVVKKPPDSTAARAAYVAGGEWLRKELDACRTVSDVTDFLESWKKLTKGNTRGPAITLEEAVEKYGKEAGSGFGAMGTAFLYDKEKRLPVVVPGELGPQRRHDIAMRKLWADGFDGFERIPQPDGKNDKLYLTRKTNSIQQTYEGYVEVMGTRIRGIVNQYTGGGRSHRTPAFWSRDRHVAAQMEKDDDWTKLDATTTKRGARGASPKKIITSWRANQTLERKGGRAIPEGVEGEALLDDFGLRAIEYGKGVNDHLAGETIRNMAGALSDLSDLLGVQPRQLAHGGRLALAFAARGRGSAGAHYEPGKVVINLTKTRGAGTLAHEWFHFIDHQLGEMRRGGGEARAGLREPTKARSMAEAMEAMAGSTPWFASHGSHLRDHMPPPVREAFDDLHRTIFGGGGAASFDGKALGARRKALNKEAKLQRTGLSKMTSVEIAKAQKQLNNEIQAFNKRVRPLGRSAWGSSKYAADAAVLGNYWSRPHELYARAFEAWAEDTLESLGRKNTFLVAGTKKKWNLTKAKKGVAAEGLEPYPHGDERAAINGAFTRLMAELSRHGVMQKAMGGIR